jgi:gamma-glutamylaminecyclotransferase
MTVTNPETKLIFICGSALRGQPDHQNLQSAQFIQAISTQPRYRLHSVQNGWHPGIYEVESGGIAIPGEIYALTLEQFDHLVASEPPHMYASNIVLENGDTAIAFLFPRELIEQYNYPDISHYGGWAAYKAAGATADLAS